MNVVIDTNVLISGIFWKGKPGKVLQLWKDDIIVLLATTDILDEYIRVISQLHSKQSDLAQEWTDFISTNIQIVLKTAKFALCRDSDDDKFLECAVSLNADCIISSDDDLLSLKEIKGIPILKASSFLARLS